MPGWNNSYFFKQQEGSIVAKPQNNEMKLEIQIDDSIADGQYINMVVVNHNDSEFVLDCIYMQPQTPKARVQSRLITSPRHAKRLLMALQKNISSYENTFGVIETENRGGSKVEGLPVH
jgi:hypothetical protein